LRFLKGRKRGGEGEVERKKKRKEVERAKAAAGELFVEILQS